MSTISIIGSGNMARAIGVRAIKGGNDVEVASRDPAKAEALARTLGGGAIAGKFGAPPAGEIVILAALCERRAGRRPVLRCAGRQGHRRHH